jgi:putative phage-type endonuclease
MQETMCIDRLIDLFHQKGQSIDEIYENVNNVFHNTVEKCFIEQRIEVVIPKYKEVLSSLLQSTGIEQKTDAWYKARKSLITASDFAQALGEGKFGTQKQFYQKKCGYEVDNFDPYIPPLKWGCMFEDVATRIYAKRNHVTVHEFGLLKHPHIDYLGASPDGITEHGIMLEIKCPFKRKITGEIPVQYLYQVQGQLDVCNLDECDYLECDFAIVKDPDEFWSSYNDIAFEKGIIAEYEKEGSPVYSYSPTTCEMGELMEWKSQHPDAIIHMWRLRQYNVVRVYRDKEFIAGKIDQLKDVWDNVTRYREDKSAYDRETINKPKKNVVNSEYSFRC